MAKTYQPLKARLKEGDRVIIISKYTNKEVSKGTILSALDSPNHYSPSNFIYKIERDDNKICKGHATRHEYPPEPGQRWGNNKWVSKFIEAEDGTIISGGWGTNQYYVVPLNTNWKDIL